MKDRYSNSNEEQVYQFSHRKEAYHPYQVFAKFCGLSMRHDDDRQCS